MTKIWSFLAGYWHFRKQRIDNRKWLVSTMIYLSTHALCFRKVEIYKVRRSFYTHGVNSHWKTSDWIFTTHKQSFAKVMFYICLSVILFTGGACPIACWDTHPLVGTPPRQVHPWQVHRPGRYTPRQVYPPAGTPPGRYPRAGTPHSPRQVHPPGQVTPPCSAC